MAMSAYALAQLEKLNPHGYQSLCDPFAQACQQYAERIAFSCLGQDLSFAELDRYSSQFASFLIHNVGLQPGDRVAVQLPNCNQYPIVAWAIMRAGLVLVNTNPLYTPRELIHQFKDSGARAVVALDQLLPAVAAIQAETDVEQLVSVEITGLLTEQPTEQSVKLKAVTLTDALALGAAQPLAPVTLAMTDTAALQYTGGTTGPSKGAIITHANLFASSVQTQDAFVVEPGVEQILIAPMPLYHIYGFTWNMISCALKGMRSVLIPNPRDIDALVQTMKGYRFTGFAGVNTLFAGLLNHPEFDQIDFSALTGTISGGAALVSSIGSDWERRTNSSIYEGYALSETSSALSCNTEQDRAAGTVGKIMPYMEVKIVDFDGNTANPGEAGELCVRGPQVTTGYWNNPTASAEAIDPDGWFKTGDVAVRDNEGFISIVDRIKDMILVSGFNVYPNEIEDVVSDHPGVLECAVIGVADERTGEAVKVFAVKSDPALTTEQLEAFCRDQLTAYKVPKQYQFVDELPKSNVGKILRRELRN